MNKEKALRELERLLSKMKDQARTLDELETAQWHYMDLGDITSSGLFDINTLEKERKENPHFIRISDGMRVFDDEQCAEFMSVKHNLPLQLCMAYVRSHKW